MPNSSFLEPMVAWPALTPYARKLFLQKSNLLLYLYEVSDNAPQTYLLIHGLGDEADTWRYIIPKLGEHSHVIAPDLPGFGRSDKPDTVYSLNYYHQVLLELIENLDVDKPILVGHSLGALIAQTLVIDHPDLFTRQVLIDGGAIFHRQMPDPQLVLFLVPLLGEWIYNRLRRDPENAFKSLERYYQDLNSLSEDDRAFLYLRVNQRVWSDDQRRAFLSTLRNLSGFVRGEQTRIIEASKQIELPTTIVWGENDQISPVENGKILAETIPTSRLFIVPRAGHNLQQEQPLSVLNILG